MRHFDSVWDLENLVGSEIGRSPELLIDQKRIDDFANATGSPEWLRDDSHQWIHLDSARALLGPFGATIAHGYLILSLLPMLDALSYEMGDVSMKINYGVDRVRFLNPLVTGSTIFSTTILSNFVPGTSGIKLFKKVTVSNLDNSHLIMVADVVTLHVLNSNIN